MFKRKFSLLTILLLLLFVCSSFAEVVKKPKGSAGKKKKASAAAVKKKKTAATKSRKRVKPVKRAAVAVVIPSAGPAELSEVRHWSTPDYTRVAITLSHDTPFEK